MLRVGKQPEKEAVVRRAPFPWIKQAHLPLGAVVLNPGWGAWKWLMPRPDLDEPGGTPWGWDSGLHQYGWIQLDTNTLQQVRSGHGEDLEAVRGAAGPGGRGEAQRMMTFQGQERKECGRWKGKGHFSKKEQCRGLLNIWRKGDAKVTRTRCREEMRRLSLVSAGLY